MGKKGFTILEILVVLSVLAILIGMAIPRIKGMQDEANKTKAKAELKTIQSAIEAYANNQNPRAYPATSASVVATTLATQTSPLVDASIYDPFAATGVGYNYMRSANGKYYVIYSIGPDATSATSAMADTGAVTTGGDDVCRTNGTGC